MQMFVTSYKTTVYFNWMGRWVTKRKSGDLPNSELKTIDFRVKGLLCMKTIFTILVLFGGAVSLFGQNNEVIVLDEVILADVKLRQFSDGIKTLTLNDSVARRNSGTFTDNLRFNTNLYFKEYGYGMTSTVAFLGTGASQTAVVWNGININSQMSGQTDFNTLLSQSVNEVVVRSGGGSTQYGTGAIGGSVHLNSVLKFEEHTSHNVNMGYGAFDTRSLFYNTSLGNTKSAFKIGVGYFGSENDYKYLGTERSNENGAFDNTAIDLSYGLVLGKTNIIQAYHQSFLGDRNFSSTLTAPSNDRYRDYNSRSLLEWVNFGSKTVQRVKAAHLYERYRYYPNNAVEDFSTGKASTALFNYDLKYRFKKVVINGISEFQYIDAEGSSIRSENRQILTGMLLVRHTPSEKFRYGVNLRKDWVSGYESPLLFSANGSYDITKAYTVSFQASKNFRIPTFNDLYWQGAGAGGNSDLVPETALQGELGQSLRFKNVLFQLNGYYIATRDLIQWRPDLAGVWTPVNVNETEQFGFELESQWNKKMTWAEVSVNGAYAFTKSLDAETGNQLLYVPLHTARANIALVKGKWTTYYQTLYNGEVFTTTDNKQTLSDYVIGNWGLEYELPKFLDMTVTAACKINNIANVEYQNIAFRPMPNRNLHFQLNFNF